MASHGRGAASAGKPIPTRLHSHSTTPERDALQLPKRAHTFQNDGKANEALPDAFETSQELENDEVADTTRTSIDLDELPIELITLTDRYVY